MNRIAYVNGRYVDQRDAMVSIDDRGFQFADGVYEYIGFYNDRWLDRDLHLQRLERSLAELSIAAPMAWNALPLVMDELRLRNRRSDGAIYMQVTRGVALREHPIPKTPLKPTLVMTICAPKLPKPPDIEKGVAVITHPDQRWARRDIKSIALLPGVLAKSAAAKAGAKEAWLVEADGRISEGGSSNAYIVDAQGTVITHPADTHILAGISRHVVLGLARAAGIAVKERPFTVVEAKAAREAFITSTSPNVLPVVKIDDAAIGNGKPGPVSKKLLELYLQHIERQTGRRL